MQTSRLLSTEVRSWNCGSELFTKTPFVMDETQLSRHIGIFGGSGCGKSKLIELLCRKLMDDYRGFCFIDPHGDTAEDLLCYAAKKTELHRNDRICKRIHYLEPTFETVFGFDPFDFQVSATIPEQMRENAYHAWLHTKADKVSEVIQRKQGQSDFQGMARLQRILRDVLIAVGTPLNAEGKHLPLSDVLVLLDTQHPRHADVMRLVLPHVPAEIRGDFASLAAMRSEEQRKKETESTINRLRSLLSPIVKAIFSSAASTIDFRNIIMNRGIILVNLRKTDFFSEDQRNAIGGLLIHEILSTVETTAREERMPYYLIVDEARLFVGQDLMEALDQARKFKLSICLAGQYLSQFKTDEFDMTPSILENCKNMICFQQSHPDNLKIWKEYFGYANLSFEKHFQIVDRPDGYDWIQVDDRSESRTRTVGRSVGGSETFGGSTTKSIGTNHTDNESNAQQQGVQQSRGSQVGSSLSDSSARTDSSNSGASTTRQPILRDGRVVDHLNVDSRNDTGGSASQHSKSSAINSSMTESEAHSASLTRTEGTADGTSQSFGEGSNWGEGANWGKSVNRSVGETISHRTIPLARTREEAHETGQLQDAVNDQFHKFAHIQTTLPDRHAMVRLSGKKESFIIKVADANDAYPKAEKFTKLNAMKKKIYALHPYYSTPALSPEEQDKKLDAFLASVQDQRIEMKSAESQKPLSFEETPFDE